MRLTTVTKLTYERIYESKNIVERKVKIYADGERDREKEKQGIGK